MNTIGYQLDFCQSPHSLDLTPRKCNMAGFASPTYTEHMIGRLGLRRREPGNISDIYGKDAA